MKTIKVKEFEVPVGAMGEVAEIIGDHELSNSITGSDEDQELVFLEVQYEKGDEEEQAAILQIQEIIDNYEEEEEEDDEEEEEG